MQVHIRFNSNHILNFMKWVYIIPRLKKINFTDMT